MSVRVPDNGYCLATGAGYEKCGTWSRSVADRQARRLAQKRGVRIDLVKVSNRGEDRNLVGEFFPKRQRWPGGDSR